MSTMSIAATTVRPITLPGRRTVPWLTVVPLAVLMGCADGFWMVSLRGAVGSIDRTQGPFATWLRESILTLPVFVFAVLGALTLALRLFGPVLRTTKTVAATALLVVAAGTLAGIAELTASSVYDYHLQSAQLQLMASMGDTCAKHSCLAEQLQATLGLQVRAVGFGSAILLVTNLVLVGWAVAMRGGRLNVSTTRERAARTPAQPGPQGQRRDGSALHPGLAVSLGHQAPALPAAATRVLDGAHNSRFDGLRPLLAAGLIGSAAIHAAVMPEHLTEWVAAAGFFVVLTAVELALSGLLLARPQLAGLPAAGIQRAVLLAAMVASLGPLALWLYSRTFSLPFGPGAGVPEPVGLADVAACVLEVTTLLAAVVLLRDRGGLRRRPTSAHVRWLSVVAVIAVTAIGLGGTSLAWFDDFGSSAGPSMTAAP